MAKKDLTVFKGLWMRGGTDSCPPDHFSDSKNHRFNTSAGKVSTRDGFGLNFTAPGASNILRAAIYKPNPPYTSVNSPREIYLTADGKLWDTKYGTAIFANAGALAITDFSLVNMFGRAYIALTDGKVGFTGTNLYVYFGDGVAIREAGGIAPTVAPTVVMAVGGNLSTGDYIFRYAYETDSGFITPLSAAVVGTSFGGYKATLTIANGPAGTVAKWIVGTKLIPLGTYAGNDEGYPFYFVERIGDNTTTSYVASYFDESLIDSADYLFDELARIPAGVGLAEYNGRVLSWGEASQPAVVRASKPGEPESFSSTSGLKTVDPADAVGLRAGVELAGNFYLFGPSSSYVTQDNGNEISTWEFNRFGNVGTERYGIADVLGEIASNKGYFLIATNSGLVLFNGSFVEPELSYKIQDLWRRINFNYFTKIQVNLDTVNKLIYILCPLDSATANNTIIVGDYTEGMDPFKIKWDIWEILFIGNYATMVCFYTYTVVSGLPTLVTKISGGLKLYDYVVGARVDFLDLIGAYFYSGPIRFGNGISQFTKITVRAKGKSSGAGSNNTAFGVASIDSSLVPVGQIQLVALPTTPTREYNFKVNLVSEYARLYVSGLTSDGSSPAGSYHIIDRLTLHGEEIFDERPNG